MDSCIRESKTSEKDNFSTQFQFTSAENVKVAESKQFSHLIDKTFTFLDTLSVIHFPMPVGAKFELKGG